MNLGRRNRCILLLIIILIIILIQVLQRVATAIRIKIRIRIRMTGSKVHGRKGHPRRRWKPPMNRTDPPSSFAPAELRQDRP